MRITNQTILNRSLGMVQQGQQEGARLQRQIATGELFEKLSEAPAAGRAALDIDNDLRASDQYSRNMEAARVRIRAADTALNSVTNLLTRAREVAIQQGGALANPQSRTAAELEIQDLKASVIQLANEKINGAFVFGGVNVDRPPLDATGALDSTFPARGAQEYEIGPGVLAQGAHDAGEMFVDSDVIGALDDLSAALAADDPTAIQASSERVRDSILGLQRLVTEVGGRENRIDVAGNAQALLSFGLEDRRSELMDAPIEVAVTRLAALQSSYQASLLATSKLLESTLVNYLR